jgi:hypothetical protein
MTDTVKGSEQVVANAREAKIAAERAEVVRLAAEVAAGGRKEIPVKATVNPDSDYEHEVSLTLRVPTLDDHAVIGAVASVYHAGTTFAQLSPWDRELARARATVEVLAVGPFPEWLPADEDGRPATGKMTGYAKLVAVFRKFNAVVAAFQ